MGITNKQRGTQLLPGLGRWENVPFNAANFTGQGASHPWTVTEANVQCNRICRLGSMIIWTVALNGTTVGGIPTQLTLVAPTRVGPTPKFCGTGMVGWPVKVAAVTVGKNDPSNGFCAVMLDDGVPFPAGSLVVNFTIMYECPQP